MGLFKKNEGISKFYLKNLLKDADIIVKYVGLSQFFILEADNVYVNLERNTEKLLEHGYLYNCIAQNKGFIAVFEQGDIVITDVLLQDDNKELEALTENDIAYSLGLAKIVLEQDNIDLVDLLKIENDIFVKELEKLSDLQLQTLTKNAMDLYVADKFDSTFKINILEKKINSIDLFIDYKKSLNFVAKDILEEI